MIKRYFVSINVMPYQKTAREPRYVRGDSTPL